MVLPAVERVFYLVLEMNAVTHIDSQGAHSIMDIASQLKGRGVQLLLSNPNPRVSALSQLAFFCSAAASPMLACVP
jgi:anti-anti-sigma regulatory factor